MTTAIDILRVLFSLLDERVILGEPLYTQSDIREEWDDESLRDYWGILFSDFSITRDVVLLTENESRGRLIIMDAVEQLTVDVLRNEDVVLAVGVPTNFLGTLKQNLLEMGIIEIGAICDKRKPLMTRRT